MITINLGNLAQIAGGKLRVGKPTTQVQACNFGYPKHIHPNQVYFYTKKISWEKQLSAIRNAKPVAVVLPYHISIYSIPPSTSIIQVKDCWQAYWKIAIWNWKKHSVRVIGITGSAGKSTTTAMVASILKYRWPMVKTEGNLNLLSCLPNYLVRLKPHHKLLLLEMGMKSLNDIKGQCSIVHPEIGAVTNVGEAHVGNLGHLDKVAKAKSELVEGIRKQGQLYVNADDARSKKLSIGKCKGTVKTFGIKNPADIQATKVEYSQYGMTFQASFKGTTHSFFIPTFGTHNVYNALAAIGICHSFGATIPEIKKGLASFTPPKMRLQLIRSRSGRLLINDAWNANPSAMIAGLKVLHSLSSAQKPTIAVLGDMLELGYLTSSSHQQVGKILSGLHVNQLVTLGPHAKLIADTAIQHGMNRNKVFSYYNHSQVIRHLTHTPRNATIYFKASRKWKLEKVVDQLR